MSSTVRHLPPSENVVQLRDLASALGKAGIGPDFADKCRASADAETFACNYRFDDLYLIRRAGKVAMPVSGHCTVSYDQDGGWDVETIFLDAWLSQRTPAKAPPIVLTQHPPNGVNCPLYRLVHDALMISDKEEIELQVRDCIREDGGSLEAAE